ncbi:hypothetical protein T03_2901 [Trichinella britovi]|uniref:Uncharacterized protein n=1 Tax=Trichinella britovi TaxID=45882 RepID=A0A0V1CRP7_TRIBR|nr:hypothetical protein T03_2901 [Trichinella britovi]
MRKVERPVGKRYQQLKWIPIGHGLVSRESIRLGRGEGKRERKRGREEKNFVKMITDSSEVKKPQPKPQCGRTRAKALTLFAKCTVLEGPLRGKFIVPGRNGNQKIASVIE